jgi:hypothetical protein
MATEFIDAVRTCLKDGGYARVNSGEEEGGTFLVGYKGVLYFIDGDYQVGIPASGYGAVGSGAQVAIGALYATQGIEPFKRVEVALQASEANNAGVRAPFVILSSRT